MTRARLAAALCVLAACGERAPAPVPPAPAPPDAAAAPSPGAQPPGGQKVGAQATPPLRRGDRHARAAARQGRSVQEVVGTVVRSEAGRLAIRPRQGREVTIRIGPRTAVAPARPPGTAAAAPGDVVRASWRAGDGDPPTAISVEVQRGTPAPPEPEPDPFNDHG